MVRYNNVAAPPSALWAAGPLRLKAVGQHLPSTRSPESDRPCISFDPDPKATVLDLDSLPPASPPGKRQRLVATPLLWAGGLTVLLALLTTTIAAGPISSALTLAGGVLAVLVGCSIILLAPLAEYRLPGAACLASGVVILVGPALAATYSLSEAPLLAGAQFALALALWIHLLERDRDRWLQKLALLGIAGAALATVTSVLPGAWHQRWLMVVPGAAFLGVLVVQARWGNWQLPGRERWLPVVATAGVAQSLCWVLGTDAAGLAPSTAAACLLAGPAALLVAALYRVQMFLGEVSRERAEFRDANRVGHHRRARSDPRVGMGYVDRPPCRPTVVVEGIGEPVQVWQADFVDFDVSDFHAGIFMGQGSSCDSVLVRAKVRVDRTAW